jgi:hypothetical protein
MNNNLEETNLLYKEQVLLEKLRQVRIKIENIRNERYKNTKPCYHKKNRGILDCPKIT